LRWWEIVGPITGDRRGTWVYYRVLPERLTQVSTLVDLAPTS